MLIKALCDYYDILAKTGQVFPEGFSEEGISYLIALTPDGTVADIIDCREQVIVPDKKGKGKEKTVPRKMLFPARESKSATNSELPEHRPLYIFGMDLGKNGFEINSKAQKSHVNFVERNLDFIKGLDSQIINAYRKFIEHWKPETELENDLLVKLGKEYSKSKYAFCLDSDSGIMLQEDNLIKEKYLCQYASEKQGEGYNAQCAISGKVSPIGRTHNKIKGVLGGQSTGTALVSFNNDSECSYCLEQSYNSNISEGAMKKYTEALNTLLADKKKHTVLGDLTIVFWAMSDNTEPVTLLNLLMGQKDDEMSEEAVNDMLFALFKDAKTGKVVRDRLMAEKKIKEDVDFYIAGIKPNSSRLSVKFLYRKRVGDILENIAQHQLDLQIIERGKPVSLWQIYQELSSPKAKDKPINPALFSKLLESVIYGTAYPAELLSRVIQRIKKDVHQTDEERGKIADISPLRMGIIKAYLNRKNRRKGEKEEITMALNQESTSPAYLCGRLFAVLEAIQREAAKPVKLNRTIKDAYFSGAAAMPGSTFAKLLQLSQYHLKKLKDKERLKAYFEKTVGEIIDKLERGFPIRLSLEEQGEFIVGYYQQRSYRKTNNNETEEENEND